MDKINNDFIFKENATNFMDKEETSNPEMFTIRTGSLRLFHVSSEVDNESKHGYDSVCDLVRRKADFIKWRLKKNKIREKKIVSVLKNLEKQIQPIYWNHAYLEVPKYIPVLMEMPADDPHRAFFGRYNWNYTGGCLGQLCFNGNRYLTYVGGKSKDKLYVAPLQCDDLTWSIDKSGERKVSASPGKEIFQVVCVEKSGNNFIGVRQKDTCLVYNYCENGSFYECFNFNSECPIASFDVSSVYEELCVINVEKGLSFWDINREDLPTTTYFPSDNPRCDNWHHLLYSADPSVIAVAGRKSLKWMDRRSSNVVYSLQLASLHGTLCDEEITMHFASVRDPYLIYMCTDLNLFLLDIRSISSAVHCWTHYLSSPPMYNCVIPYGEDEIVCIGNQYPGNLVLAFSSKSKTCPLVKIPSRLDSLYSLQAAGLYLDPSVKPRMTLGLTGLTYLKCDDSSNVELLTQTVASDIFSQSLFDQSTVVNSDTLNGLVTTKETLHTTERWNMRKLYQELSKCDAEQDIPKKFNTGKQAWQLSKQKLVEYKDVLSSLILEEWEIGQVNEKYGVSGEQKVNAWLDSSFNTVYTSQERSFLWEDE